MQITQFYVYFFFFFSVGGVTGSPYLECIGSGNGRSLLQGSAIGVGRFEIIGSRLIVLIHAFVFGRKSTGQGGYQTDYRHWRPANRSPPQDVTTKEKSPPAAAESNPRPSFSGSRYRP